MTTPMNSRLRALKPAQWPEAHQRAWEAALKPGDLLEEAGAAAAWRPRSSAKTAAGYGLWLAWLVSQGHILKGAPEALATREWVRAWLDDVAVRGSPYTLACRAQELFDALRVMAPDDDWAWLKQVSIKARRQARPSRNKIARLRSAQEIEHLGLTLMHEAHDSAFRGTPLQRARQFRDGLIIALLITRLPRLKNITQIELGRHLVHHGNKAVMAFGAAEMKGKRSWQVALPGHLISWLQLYLEQYRPFLLRSQVEDHGRLWVAQTGAPLAEVSLHNAVRRRIKAAFGKPIPPHWFRDAGITTLVIHNPRHAKDSQELLDHHSGQTWDKHYNHGQAIDGARKYHEVLRALRSK